MTRRDPRVLHLVVPLDVEADRIRARGSSARPRQHSRYGRTVRSAGQKAADVVARSERFDARLEQLDEALAQLVERPAVVFDKGRLPVLTDR